ncbi:MAG: hypothetical protein AAF757_25700, partial [Cyanobacteria bacterium P01_D01_bin.116]
VSEETGEESFDEDASVSEETGEESFDEDASVSEETGEESFDEDASVSQEPGDDSLSEDGSVSQEPGDDSLSEDGSVSEEAGDESFDEDGSVSQEAGDESLSEEFEEGDNQTSASNKELCDDGSLPKGNAVKVSGDGSTPISGLGAEDGSDTEEDSLGDDASITDGPGEETLGEIASIGDGGGEESFDEGDSSLDEGGEEGGEEPVDEGDSTLDEGGEEGDSTQKETESNPKNQPQRRRVDPFADFPKYKGEKPYVCGTQIARIDRRTRRTSDSLIDVQAYFDKKLADTDFQVEKLTDKSDTKVYQISKGNLTQYLQLFAVKEQGTMILLSSQRVDCYRLSNQEQQEKPKAEEQAFDATFLLLYAELGWTEEKDFATTPEVEKIFGKDANKTPDELALLVKKKLESEGFETSQVNEESSEILYEVKKGEFSKYISFVPTKEGKGAIILALKNSP